jgi:hypothetical protein
MPIEQVTSSSRSSITTGCDSCSITFWATCATSEERFTFRQHHHELVAADAADGVADAQLVHQPRGDFLQQLVADRVAERVVDGLEAIQVDEHHRGALAVAVAERERLREAVLQQAAIGQRGERVVVGEVLACFFASSSSAVRSATARSSSPRACCTRRSASRSAVTSS